MPTIIQGTTMIIFGIALYKRRYYVIIIIIFMNEFDFTTTL